MDDNTDGQWKPQVDRAIADAESYVESFLGGNYNLDTIRAMGIEGTNDVPNEIKRIILDLVTAYLWDRFPEYIRADGRRIKQDARAELMDIRKGRTQLDITGAPEPAKNQGGPTRSGDPDEPSPVDKFYNDPNSFGIF
jgi:hypothetical protein